MADKASRAPDRKVLATSLGFAPGAYALDLFQRLGWIADYTTADAVVVGAILAFVAGYFTPNKD